MEKLLYPNSLVLSVQPSPDALKEVNRNGDIERKETVKQVILSHLCLLLPEDVDNAEQL